MRKTLDYANPLEIHASQHAYRQRARRVLRPDGRRTTILVVAILLFGLAVLALPAVVRELSDEMSQPKPVPPLPSYK